MSDLQPTCYCDPGKPHSCGIMDGREEAPQQCGNVSPNSPEANGLSDYALKGAGSREIKRNTQSADCLSLTHDPQVHPAVGSQAPPAGTDIPQQQTQSSVCADGEPVRSGESAPRKEPSAIPEDWEFKNTPDGLRDAAKIATFALSNAFFRLSASKDDADKKAADILEPLWNRASGAFGFLVDVYCRVKTKKRWSELQKYKVRLVAEKKQAGAA